MSQQTVQTGTMATLRDDATVALWLDYLEEIGPPEVAILLPDGDAFMAALDELSVPKDDIATLVSMREAIMNDPALMWLMERACNSLLLRMDTVDSPPGFHVLPESVGSVAPFFYVYLCVAMLPFTKALHLQRSIPEDISRATLADIGRNMLVHRKRHGTHGLAAPDWLTLHMRGMIFQLGRLQFERAKLGGMTGDAIQAAGLAWKTGDPMLSIHISDFAGPMSEDACDASFAAAREFFPLHFPEEPVHIAVCNSWLLDAQLRDYLSQASNTIKFQHRFREIRQAEWANDGPLRFVFGATDLPLDDYPQETSVQRGVVTHLKAGKDWHGGMGWLELQ